MSNNQPPNQQGMGNHKIVHNVPNKHNQDWKNIANQLKVKLNNLNISPVERPDEFYGAISKLIEENHYFLTFIDQLQKRFGINPRERPDEFYGAINKLIGENRYFLNFIDQLQKRFGINPGENPEIILERVDNLITENEDFNSSMDIYETKSKELARYQNEVEPRLNLIIESKSAEYDDLVSKYKQLHAENENLTNKYNDLMPKYNDLVPKYKQLHAENENLTNKYNDLMPKYNDLVPKYNQLHAENENLTNKYNDFMPKYNDLVPKYNDLVPKYNQLHAENENLTNDLNSCKEQIKNMEIQYNANITKMEEFYNNKITEKEKDCKKLEDKGNYFYDELVKKNDIIQDLTDKFDKLNRYQQETEPKYKEKINSLNNKLDINQQEITTLKNKIFREKANYDKLNGENKTLQQYKSYAEGKIFNLEADNHNKDLSVKDLEKSKLELEAINEKLKKEASSYQSVLGDALNFRLSDEDNNNSVQLSADINALQDRLEKYVTTLKGQITVDKDKIQELYGKYNLVTQNLTDKILMKSVLQRHVLEKILEYIDNYLEDKEDDPSNPISQEKYIMRYTNGLISLLDNFYSSHFEQDNNVIKAIPTKIRQQIYGILGEFGFSETCENKKKQYMHPFISSTALELNQLMAGYRYIKNDTKRKNLENMAENLIKDVVRIFKFRLLVQEPKCETYWFDKDVKINPQFMKGQWDDDCLDDYVVDICYFPLIGMELNDRSKSKVCTHAKVFPRSIAPPPSPPSPSPPPPEDHPPLNNEPQENSSSIRGAIKGIFNKILPATPSYSTTSQNSASSDHNKDQNRRRNSDNSDRSNDPNRRQNPASSDHNKDPNSRQNSANSDHNKDPNSRQNSASSDHNKVPNRRRNSDNIDRSNDPNRRQNPASSDHNKDPNWRQNPASSDHNRDPNKRQNSDNVDHNRDPNKRQNSDNGDRSNDPNKRQNSANSDHNKDPNDNNLSRGHNCFQQSPGDNVNDELQEKTPKSHAQSKSIDNVNSCNSTGNNNETSPPPIETPSVPSTNDGASTSLLSSKEEVNDPQDNNNQITTTSNVNNNGGSNTSDNKTTDNNSDNQDDNKSKNDEGGKAKGVENQSSIGNDASKIGGSENRIDGDSEKVTNENGNGENSQAKEVVGKPKSSKKDKAKAKKIVNNKSTGDEQGKKKNSDFGQSNNDSLNEDGYVLM